MRPVLPDYIFTSNYDIIYGINLTNTRGYFELHYGPKIWFIFIKKTCGKISHFGDFYGETTINTQ